MQNFQSFTFEFQSSLLPSYHVHRAIAGLFGGSISVAQAYIADVTPPKDRARYMGILGAAIGLGRFGSLLFTL